MFRRFPLCSQIGGKCNLVYRPLSILSYILLSLTGSSVLLKEITLSALFFQVCTPLVSSFLHEWDLINYFAMYHYHLSS